MSEEAEACVSLSTGLKHAVTVYERSEKHVCGYTVGGKKVIPWADIFPDGDKDRADSDKNGDIQKGARAKDFEPEIEWLIDAGIIYKVPRVRKAGVPLKFYEDFSAFKLFLLDHGLMGAMADAPASEILLGNSIFSEYKGSFTEQYVFEQMRCSSEREIFFYDSETSKLELDFLFVSFSRTTPYLAR